MLSFLESIEVAEKITSNYARTHKGKNKLEKECIKQGYLIKKYKEIFKFCIESEKIESEKEKTGVFALDFNSMLRKGGFILIR
jgi:hypothetical protein